MIVKIYPFGNHSGRSASRPRNFQEKRGVFMQKTFIKYTFIIITAAILLILLINFVCSLNTLETRQLDTFYTKTEQMIHTLENNREELRLLRESLDEDYLTRAKAAAYVMDHVEEVSMDVSQMQYLANLLNVDEIHIIDENGIIVAGSVSEYVGIDMHDHPQTSAFLPLLENHGEDAYLIQEAQPNAAEAKMMQYVGVARKGQKGVIQVGLTPTRQLAAQSRNTYEYIFSKFPTDKGEELFVVDSKTGTVLGHSDGIDMDFSAECYQLEHLKDCSKGAYKQGRDNVRMYVVSRQHDDILLCAALPKSIFLRRLWLGMLATLICLFCIEAAVILLLNYLVKKKVINGIHHINENLTMITNGNLDTKVAVGGNSEFEELSRGINTMVKSIVSLSDRISAIIEISGIPLAAFEYERGVKQLFVTSGLSELLNLSKQQSAKLYQDAAQFDQYIRNITQTPVEGESDIYQISDSRYIRIHMSESGNSCLGVISDVTKGMLQKKRMQYENTHDPLTGLYKFNPFKHLAAKTLHAMPSGRLCAMVMLDLDCFKSINDTYGHDAGDLYLQDFASIIQKMPPEHCLSARRSGDEFCMMIYDCNNKDEVTAHLDVFYDMLGQHKVSLSADQSKSISVSSGFALADTPDTGIEDLLARADEALYEVKRTTKGHYAAFMPSSPDAG